MKSGCFPPSTEFTIRQRDYCVDNVITDVQPCESASNIGSPTSSLSSERQRKQIALELEKKKLELELRRAELEAEEKTPALSNPGSLVTRRFKVTKKPGSSLPGLDSLRQHMAYNTFALHNLGTVSTTITGYIPGVGHSFHDQTYRCCTNIDQVDGLPRAYHSQQNLPHNISTASYTPHKFENKTLHLAQQSTSVQS